jgi:archaellum biogenesis ATPase FlaH/uncharacterized protein YoaH (UPF0181 family)
VREQYPETYAKAKVFPLAFTVVESANGTLTKSYEPGEDGIPVSTGGTGLSRGVARRIESNGTAVEHLQKLYSLLQELNQNQAIITAAPPSGAQEWTIGTKDDVASGAAQIARTTEFFNVESGAALLCLDLDIKTYPKAIRDRVDQLGGTIAALTEAFPELLQAAHIRRASASSGISNPKAGSTTGPAGEHIYFVVSDGADTKGFAQRLHDRLLLAGWGWGEVSKSGRVLTRTLIDKAATEPGRLVFEADAVLKDGLVYESKREVSARRGDVLETSLLPRLSHDEVSQLANSVAEIKEQRADEAHKVQQAWRDDRIRKLQSDGLSPGKAAALTSQAVDRQELSGGFEILLDNGTCVTIADILNDRKSFHQKTCADPLEPDYGSGQNLAVIYTDHPARIWSHAHGGTDYKLVKSEHEFFDPISIDELTEDDALREMFADDANQKSDDLYESLSIDDIFQLPDPVFAIERHIPEASMGFLYGEPGSGKSFIALDWALHIAYGLPRWHEDAITTRPNSSVVYLAREGSSGFKARIRAWQEGHLLPHGVRPRFELIRQSMDFLKTDDLEKLVRTVRSRAKDSVDLIVVDTLSRVMPGADENLQKEMTKFVKACDLLQDTFGCIVLGVHHSGKQGDMRGSSVLKGAGDFVFKLEQQKDTDIKSLFCEKQKDAPDGWRENYRLREISWGEGDQAGSSLVVDQLPKINASKKQATDDEAFATAILPLMVDRDSVLWAEIRERAGERLRGAGLTNVTARSKLTEEVSQRLTGLGIDFTANGQTVNLSMFKSAQKPTSPWQIKRTIVSIAEGPK